MNHKRGKPKNSRAGCLMCKPHKSNDFKDSLKFQTIQERKSIEDEADQLIEIFECTFPVTGKRNFIREVR